MNYAPDSVEIRRRQLDRFRAKLGHARRCCHDEQDRLRAARQRLADQRDAQAVLQAAAETVQRTAHRRIAAVVARCLTAVFGDDAYGFRIDFVKRRGKTEAEFMLVRDGLEIEPAAAGGGVVDVVSFALRLACLLLTVPQKRRLLVLDEPFRFVSKNYRPAVRQLVEALADELQVQVVLVTHDPAFEMGKVVEL